MKFQICKSDIEDFFFFLIEFNKSIDKKFKYQYLTHIFEILNIPIPHVPYKSVALVRHK